MQANNGLVMVAECKLGLEEQAQPQGLNYYHKIWSHSFSNKLGQSFAPTFILELMGAGLRYALGSYDRTSYKAPQIATIMQQCRQKYHHLHSLAL